MSDDDRDKEKATVVPRVVKAGGITGNTYPPGVKYKNSVPLDIQGKAIETMIGYEGYPGLSQEGAQQIPKFLGTSYQTPYVPHPDADIYVNNSDIGYEARTMMNSSNDKPVLRINIKGYTDVRDRDLTALLMNGETQQAKELFRQTIEYDEIMRDIHDFSSDTHPVEVHTQGLSSSAEIDITGHSLGGFKARIIAHDIAVQHPEFSVEVDALNAHIIKPNGLEPLPANVKMRYHTIENDPVNFKDIDFVTSEMQNPNTEFTLYRSLNTASITPADSVALSSENHNINAFVDTHRFADPDTQGDMISLSDTGALDRSLPMVVNSENELVNAPESSTSGLGYQTASTLAETGVLTGEGVLAEKIVGQNPGDSQAEHTAKVVGVLGGIHTLARATGQTAVNVARQAAVRASKQELIQAAKQGFVTGGIAGASEIPVIGTAVATGTAAQYGTNKLLDAAMKDSDMSKKTKNQIKDVTGGFTGGTIGGVAGAGMGAFLGLGVFDEVTVPAVAALGGSIGTAIGGTQALLESDEENDDDDIVIEKMKKMIPIEDDLPPGKKLLFAQELRASKDSNRSPEFREKARQMLYKIVEDNKKLDMNFKPKPPTKVGAVGDVSVAHQKIVDYLVKNSKIIKIAYLDHPPRYFPTIEGLIYV